MIGGNKSINTEQSNQHQISDYGAIKLTKSLRYPMATKIIPSLIYVKNSIIEVFPDEPIKYLKLTELNLGYNNIGNTGAKALANEIPSSQLTSLNLQNNLISNIGAEALAKALKNVNSQLKTLDLYSNGIDDDILSHIESFLKDKAKHG